MEAGYPLGDPPRSLADVRQPLEICPEEDHLDRRGAGGHDVRPHLLDDEAPDARDGPHGVGLNAVDHLPDVPPALRGVHQRHHHEGRVHRAHAVAREVGAARLEAHLGRDLDDLRLLQEEPLDLRGDLRGARKGRSRRRLQLDEGLRDVRQGHHLAADARVEGHTHQDGCQRDTEHREPVPERPAQAPPVAALEALQEALAGVEQPPPEPPPAAPGLARLRGEEMGSQESREGERDQRRGQQPQDDGPDDPLEHVLDDPAGEGQRQQRHAEHERDGEHRQPHLGDTVHGRILGRLAHAKVALDGVDVDDGVVHQPADGDEQPDERGAVERHPQWHHGQQRHAERHGNGDHRDEGAPQVAQEEQHHEPRQEDGHHQLHHHVLHQEADEGGAVVGHLEAQAREVLLDLRQLGLDALDDPDRRGLGLLHDGDLHGLLAVEPVQAPLLAGGVGDLRHVPQVDHAAVHAGDGIAGHLLGGARPRVRPHQHLALLERERPRGARQVLHVQRVPHVEEAHPVGRQPLAVHDHLHLELFAPEGDDRVHVLDHLQPVDHLVLDQGAELHRVIPIPRHRQREDGKVQGIDGQDPRGLEVGAGHGQIGLDHVHEGLDVEDRLLHVRAVPELHRDDGEALLRGRADEVDVLEIHHPFLDGLGEVDLHLLCRKPRHHRDHGDDRAFHVGHHASWHLEHHDEHGEERDAEVEGDDDVGVLDGPAADIGAVSRTAGRVQHVIAQGTPPC